jgi:hypothetical protein
MGSNYIGKEEIQKDVFYTSSLNVIAYLKTKGVNCESVTKFNGKSLFLYIKNESLQQYLDEYKADKKLQSFLIELRNVKESLSK